MAKHLGVLSFAVLFLKADYAELSVFNLTHILPLLFFFFLIHLNLTE